MKKKLVASLLALSSLLPLAVSCGGPVEISTTTPAETTTAVTTPAPKPDTPLPSDQYDSQFAEPSYLLMRQIIKDYWRTMYLRTDLNNSTPAVVWGFASFMEAVAEAYRLFPEDKTIQKAYENAMTKGIEKYKVTETIDTPTGQYTVSYYNAGSGGRGDYYYDDDAWICIQFLNAYELLKDDKYLAEAEETLKFLWTGWDDVLGGGIYWDKTYGGKNTCANGPVAIAFLWAYQITKNEDYLTKGRMVYDWTREVLLDKGSNLYSDAISKSGSINNWKAAYNQGTMIYAGAQLYEITGDETYLTQARATNDASIGLMFSGRGSATKMNGNPIYKSWCVGWLARGYIKFYSVDPKKDTSAMTNLEAVLKKTLKSKNKKGYYDPYFMSGGWADESTTDVLQPCGVASVLCLATYYDEFMVAKNAD